jgi:hypothetical protein
MSLGARITGVDDKTYSSTGEAFSTILLPNSESNASKELQADDVSLGALPPTRTVAGPLAHICRLRVRSLRVLEEVPFVEPLDRTPRHPVCHVCVCA